ncbi:MAG: alpha/beta hydrolase [Cyclobacteriaceae bacterium]
MKRCLVVMIGLMGLISCSEDGEFGSSVQDFFHVEIANAQLPVKVRGNTNSRKIILFIPGGPGGTGLDVSEIDPGNWKQTIEKQFAMAYYDQRGIGNAQGAYKPSSITIEQYIEDMHGIIRVLHKRYPNSEVFLMGHSFGAMLVYRYMNVYGGEQLVKKYIAASGTGTRVVDDEHWTSRTSYVEAIASENVSNQVDVAYWQEALDWLSQNPEMETIQQKAHLFQYMQATGIEENVKISFSDVFNILLFSDNNFFPYYLTLKKRQSLLDNLIRQERKWDIKAEISKLTFPLLLIGGEFDFSVPPQELMWIHETAPASEKELVILENAGHDHYISQPNLFYQAVYNFISD